MKARRRFAQHFLEPAWVTKLVSAIGATPSDSFIEIGPGRGAITRPLAAQARRLLAIEVDRDLARDLESGRPSNVTVIVGDVLSLDLRELTSSWLGQHGDAAAPVRVVGNLPYNISSPILFALLAFASTDNSVRDAVLMLQKEVADRLIARPGTREYGVLTVLTAMHADVTRLLSLPPGAFRPPPKVHSAVIRLAFRPPTVELGDHGRFVALVRSVFTQRRKTLDNALKAFASQLGRSSSEVLRQVGIDGRRRPETLTIAEFATLSRALHVAGS